eukprot:9471205-Pyramimonas_sp.AAC.1
MRRVTRSSPGWWVCAWEQKCSWERRYHATDSCGRRHDRRSCPARCWCHIVPRSPCIAPPVPPQYNSEGGRCLQDTLPGRSPSDRTRSWRPRRTRVVGLWWASWLSGTWKDCLSGTRKWVRQLLEMRWVTRSSPAWWACAWVRRYSATGSCGRRRDRRSCPAHHSCRIPSPPRIAAPVSQSHSSAGRCLRGTLTVQSQSGRICSSHPRGTRVVGLWWVCELVITWSGTRSAPWSAPRSLIEEETHISPRPGVVLRIAHALPCCRPQRFRHRIDIADNIANWLGV